MHGVWAENLTINFPLSVSAFVWFVWVVTSVEVATYCARHVWDEGCANTGRHGGA
jgi:hypothetical protein